MNELIAIEPTVQNLNSIKLKTLSFKTPRKLYALHRFLFRATNGIWNDTVGALLSAINGKYDSIDAKTSMFKFSADDIKNIVKKMNADGYCVFDQKIPDAIVDRLIKFSRETPVQYLLPSESYRKDGTNMSEQCDLLENVLGKSTMYKLPLRDLINCPGIQSIILDPLLLSVAQEYLGVKPIFSSMNMWWSFPIKEREKFTAAAAQEYHFDMDHLKFFNFFVYLTDVTADTGPHCFVRGSHKKLPSQFRQRGRFSDQTVRSYYKDDVIELTGKKGTLMAVDTRGLHKGKPLESGSRLMIQMGFCNSLFGEQYPYIKMENLSEEKRRFANQYYQSFFKYL